MKYFVKDGDPKIWVKTKKAKPIGKDKAWLEYELQDGTVGLAQPKNWKQQE